MFGKHLIAAALCGLFLIVTAAPVQAAWTWDWDCWCWKQPGNNNDDDEDDSGDDGDTSITASNGAKYSVLAETVPYTGRTHLILIHDDAFFPERTYAAYGDRVLFVNMTDSSFKVEASDETWKSNSLGNEDGYLLLIQEGVDIDFEKSVSCSYNCSSGFSGEISLSDLPTKADYWEDVLDISDLLTKFGVSTTLLTSTLSFVAGLQESLGITDVVTSVL